MSKITQYDNPKVGCYIDESAGSADRLNRRILEFAEAYGGAFKFNGWFDGLRGRSLEMSLEQAEIASHAGQCDEDVKELAKDPAIVAQLEKFTADQIRESLKEYGAWDADELADDDQNKLRVVWSSACDIKENLSEQLNETADEAVSFLNNLESRSYMAWTVDDNSLFLIADVEAAKEDVGFVSNKHIEYPSDDYRGEWLHVSDHGNATLYVRGEDGKDQEVWGVV